MGEGDRDHRSRNVVRSVLSEIWLILPEKLQQIVEFLQLRVDGAQLSAEELVAQFGPAVLHKPQEQDPIQVYDGVGVIDVFGTLAPRMNVMSRMSGGTSTQELAKNVRRAGAMPEVKSVILRVDSPGGAYSFTPEVASEIRHLAKEKRVVASATNAMASGAYWVGSAADKVYATSSTAVGSVGVYTVLPNAKEYYEKQGIRFTVLRGGALKAAGNPYEEMTGDRLQALQDQISAVYQQFVTAVAEHRGVSVSVAEERFGQGSTFWAEEALSRGMIDGVATFEEVLAREVDRLSSGRSNATRTLVKEEKRMAISARVKAALFALGHVDSLEVSDEVMTAVISAIARERGVDASGMTEAQMVDMLSQPKLLLGITQATDLCAPAPSAGGAGLEERARIQSIVARAKNLPHITQDMINAAIESGQPADAVVAGWVDTLAAVEKAEAPQIVPGASQLEKFVDGASEVLISRTMGGGNQETLRGVGRSMRHTTMLDIARKVLSAHSVRIDSNPEQVALDFLKLGGTDVQPLVAGEGTVSRRGDHPDLLSSLAGKALQRGYPLAAVKYSQWCAKLEDVSDFKPKLFIETGIFDQLDLIMEDEAVRELKFSSDLAAWYQVDRYSNKVGLTVEMIIDDDLGGFARQLTSLAIASEQTINKLCLSLLASNPTMLDGNALFSAAHGNLVSGGSGGPPSSGEASDMRKLHRLMKGYANQEMDTPPSWALVPANLEEAALQTFMIGVWDPKIAATDATINTVRGEITPIVDARLDGFSAVQWYTGVNPAVLPVIAYAFMRGYGSDGQRRTWFDNDRSTRYVALESRFAAAAVGWRGMVLNAGA